MSSLQSFLAAANDLQIKGLTAPTVNSFRKTKSLEVDNTGGGTGSPLVKKIKRERSDPDTNRSVLKRRNTEEIKQEDENETQLKDDPDNLEDNFDAQQQAEEISYDELSQDQDGGANFQEDGHWLWVFCLWVFF